MSVFYVVQWTAFRDDLPAVEAAIVALHDHVQREHPSIRSVRCFRSQFGGAPARPGFIWMEEFESLTAIDESDRSETTAGCTEVWDAIYARAVPGSVTIELWRDQTRDRWFQREAPPDPHKES
jgi:hypothetical protein